MTYDMHTASLGPPPAPRATSEPHTILLWSALTIGLLATASNARAQQHNGDTLETVVVTAQKVRQNINDVGMSIVEVSGEQLTRNGIVVPEDLAKEVPGLVFARAQGGEPTYTIRGVGFNDVSISAPPTVGMYVNEVPLPYSSMAEGAMLDLQRIEVLKGPQGTLYGQNSTGGTINFIANKPTGDFELGGDVAYMSYDEISVDGFVSGPLSDSIRARVAFSTDDGGAWQQSETRHAILGAKRKYIGRLLLDWHPTDGLKAEFNLNGWIDRSDEQAPQALYLFYYPPGPPGAPATPAPLLAAYNGYVAAELVPPNNARQADWDPAVPFGAIDPINGTTHRGYGRNDSFVQTSLRVDYDLGDRAVLTSVTAWERLYENDLIDGDGLNVNNTNISQLGIVNTLSQELRLSGRLGRLEWLIGGNYEKDHNHNGAAIFSNGGILIPFGQIFGNYSTTPGDSSGPVSLERVQTVAAFAHADYAIMQPLHLVAGIRYTDVRIHDDSCTYDGGDGVLAGFATAVADSPPYNNHIFVRPGGCITLDNLTGLPGIVTSTLDETNVPFSLGLNWKVARDSLLYVSVSRGFKAGTFSSVGAFFSNLLDPARQERLTAYEGGAKLNLAGNHLQVNSALFHYDYDDKQVLGTVQEDNFFVPLATATVNIPKSRIRGAELDILWVPDAQWRVDLGATYLDSKITEASAVDDRTALNLPRDVTGEVLPQTPKWEFRGDLEYDFALWHEAGGFIGAHANYQSKLFSGLGEEPLTEVNAYATLDLRLGMRSPDRRWTGTLFVDNVADRYSWNWAGKPGNDMVFRFANPPRIFGLRLSYAR